ncbi:HinT-interacting membrane complex lipoprotein P60 [Mycoplasma crocodyli]|uniref:Putative lipoprotein n=1 Tax=Mycoplasma crocodyli (strain ATCC 51981 / MP145) TaxID=512564 RepID=D5E6F0_MYCCM|nr:hypothetical protein [Mycoplasma crocodyli]ADE19367.1 putative lipoprotein [Mycoplasma crocodyli MP145]
MKRKLLILSTLSTSVIAPIAFTISCGKNQDSSDLIKQDELFKGANVKVVAEKIWTEKTLASLYNIKAPTLNDEFLNKESQYYKDAYQAFKTFSEFSVGLDELFYMKQLSTWSSQGIFTADEANKLASITKGQPTEEQFNIIYKNKATGFSIDLNKLLLVNKYFDIKDDKSLLKIHPDYAKNKPNYDTNQYNLIAYAMSKNFVQKWEYVSKEVTDLFSEKTKTINKISDFTKLLSKTYEQSVVANEQLLFTENKETELKLGGYVGLVADGINAYGLDVDMDKLKNATKGFLYGFYSNNDDKSLVHLKTNSEDFEKSIPLYNVKNKDLSVTYLNLILPIGKEVEEKDKDGKVTGKSKVLSFDNTIYKDHLTKLSFSFVLADKNVFDVAKSAFIKLGYKLQVDDPILKETLKGSDLI